MGIPRRRPPEKPGLRRPNRRLSRRRPLAPKRARVGERPKARQPRRRSERANRSAEGREATRRQGPQSGASAPRIPRSYKPRKGEAVVPNKAHCTGPDVFDQPGCETIRAR
jgi:hypothetical protein